MEKINYNFTDTELYILNNIYKYCLTTRKQIAEFHGTKISTAGTHIENIKLKLCVNNLTDIIIVLNKDGFFNKEEVRNGRF